MKLINFTADFQSDVVGDCSGGVDGRQGVFGRVRPLRALHADGRENAVVLMMVNVVEQEVDDWLSTSAM